MLRVITEVLGKGKDGTVQGQVVHRIGICCRCTHIRIWLILTTPIRFRTVMS